MADNFPTTPGTGGEVASDEISYSGDTAHVQLVRVTEVEGAEGARTERRSGWVTGSGTLTAQDQAVTLVLAGQAATSFQLTGTWSATITFEAIVNGDWTSIFSFKAGDNVLSTTATSNDIYRCTTAALTSVRARCSAWTSGAIVISAAASPQTSGTLLFAPLPAGTNNVGDMDVVSVPADPFGVNADAASATGSISAKLRSIAAVGIPITALPASTNTIEMVGDVAHSAGVAGNPVLNAAVSQDTDDTAPPNRVDAEGDATRIASDRDGAVFVRTHGPQMWSYHVNGSSALTDASVHAAPGAGLSLYVTDIVISLGAATALNVFFEEGASTVLGPFYLEAVNGRGVVLRFATPKKITANTALTVTSSAAVAHSIDVTGFTAQG